MKIIEPRGKFSHNVVQSAKCVARPWIYDSCGLSSFSSSPNWGRFGWWESFGGGQFVLSFRRFLPPRCDRGSVWWRDSELRIASSIFLAFYSEKVPNSGCRHWMYFLMQFTRFFFVFPNFTSFQTRGISRNGNKIDRSAK